MSDTTPQLLIKDYYPYTLLVELSRDPNIELKYKGEDLTVTVRQNVMFDIGPITDSEISKYYDKGIYTLQYPEVIPGVLPTPRVSKLIPGDGAKWIPNPHYDTYTPPTLTEAEINRLHAEVQTLKGLWEQEVREITSIVNLLNTWPAPDKKSIDGHDIRYYYHCPIPNSTFINQIYLKISASKGIPSLRMSGRVRVDIMVNGLSIDTITLPIVNGTIDRTPILDYLASMVEGLQAFSDVLDNS